MITFRTLKRRRPDVYREVPVPPQLIAALEKHIDVSGNQAQDTPLWAQDGRQINRITAYRWIKHTMRSAEINGVHACPKDLRHGYGIQAVRSGVQLNMLQKWMGHAAMATTAIYANATGKEEIEIADRMWEG